MLCSLVSLAALASTVLGCADHASYNFQPRNLGKRQSGSGSITTNPGRNATDWSYDRSYDWGRINPNYALCQTGTQQAPVSLGRSQGISLRNAPNFDAYPENVTGNWYNWGYGPAFSLYHADHNYTSLPQMRFGDEVAYLYGWHIHAPADHIIDGYRAKAELHMVHVDEEGKYKAVIGIRLDAGSENSTFLETLPPIFSFNDTSVMSNVNWDPRGPLAEINYFREFWTYRGSLTSPPCTEGVQWYVSRNVLFLGRSQMQNLLLHSAYSARAIQDVWEHEINLG